MVSRVKRRPKAVFPNYGDKMGYYERPLPCLTEKQLKKILGEEQEDAGYYEWPKPCLSEAQLEKMYATMQEVAADKIGRRINFIEYPAS